MTNVNDSSKSRIINQGKVYAECGAARVIEHLNQGEASNAPFSSRPTTPWYAVVLGEETFQTVTDPSAAVMMAQLINAGYKAGVANTTANAVNLMLGNIGKPSSPFTDNIKEHLKKSHEADHESYPAEGNSVTNIVKDIDKAQKEASKESNTGTLDTSETVGEKEKEESK